MLAPVALPHCLILPHPAFHTALHCMPLSQQTPAHGWSRLARGLLAVVFLGVIGAGPQGTGPAGAQSSWGGDQRNTDRAYDRTAPWASQKADPWGRHEPTGRVEASRNHGAPGRVPDWAVPYEADPHGAVSHLDESGTDQVNNGIGSGIQPHMGITPPSNPDRVSLGGLEWLLAAGAGYAAYRLRGKHTGSATVDGLLP